MFSSPRRTQDISRCKMTELEILERYVKAHIMFITPELERIQELKTLAGETK